MEITILGTGTPLPSNDRCGGAQLITSGDDAIVIDMGWGAARRLIASGFPLARVNAIFFTHMHSDHITDLPDLMIMRWTMGATQPLVIYGPEGTRQMADGFHSALQADIGYRFAHHGEKLSREGIAYEVHEVPATKEARHIADVGGISVSSFEVDHWPVAPAFGFKVEAGGKTAVFSGDTKKVQSLVDAARGADVLVSEAVNAGFMMDRVNLLRSRGDERTAGILVEAIDYHVQPHEVAEMARDAGVKRVIITHLLPPIANDDGLEARFIEGMSEIYGGPIEVARDLQKFVV